MKNYKVFFILFVIFCISACKNSTKTEYTEPDLINIYANPRAVNPGESAVIRAVAADDDGDELKYTWSTDHGSPLSVDNSRSSSFTWTSPDSAGSYFISCTVTDGRESKMGAVLIPVGDTIRLRISIHTIDPLPASSKVTMETELNRTYYFPGEFYDNSEELQTDEAAIDSTGCFNFLFINKSVPSIGGILVKKFTFNDGLGYSRTREFPDNLFILWTGLNDVSNWAFGY